MPRYQTAAVYYPGHPTVTRTKTRRKIKLRKRAVRRVKLLAAALVNLVCIVSCSFAVIFALMTMLFFLA